jgi:hypothetical protein
MSSERLSRNFFDDISVISLDAARPDETKRDIARRDIALSRMAGSGGNLVYLATVGLIATSIIGVFFGTGFLLLLSSSDGAISGPVSRDRVPETQSPTRSLLTFPQRSDQTSIDKLESDPTPEPAWGGAFRPSASRPPLGVVTDRTALQEKSGMLRSSAATSAAIEALGGATTSISTHNEAKAEAEQTKGDRIASVNSAVLSDPISKSPGLTAPTPSPSAAETSELLTQGDARLSSGDVAAARLFYERAATAGNGRAALRLGATFDPAFLRRAGLRNVQGDTAKAQSWYSLATDLGAIKMMHPSDSIETSQGR